MLFRAKHVSAVSRILSLNPLGCALGLLKLINSVRRSSLHLPNYYETRCTLSISPQILNLEILIIKL